ELERGELIEYPGNYEKFRILRAERREAMARQYGKQQDKIRQGQAFIDRYRAGQRAKQAQGREKGLARYIESETMERPVDLSDIGMRLPPAARSGDLVINAENVSKSYENGKKKLFQSLTLTVKSGARIGVIGPNGAGKSTLIRCLLGELE